MKHLHLWYLIWAWTIFWRSCLGYLCLFLTEVSLCTHYSTTYIWGCLCNHWSTTYVWDCLYTCYSTTYFWGCLYSRYSTTYVWDCLYTRYSTHYVWGCLCAPCSITYVWGCLSHCSTNYVWGSLLYPTLLSVVIWWYVFMFKPVLACLPRTLLFFALQFCLSFLPLSQPCALL